MDNKNTKCLWLHGGVKPHVTNDMSETHGWTATSHFESGVSRDVVRYEMSQF